MNSLIVYPEVIPMDVCLEMTQVPRDLLVEVMRKCVDDHRHDCSAHPADCADWEDYEGHKELVEMSKVIGPETVKIISITSMGQERWNCTHQVEFCYTETPATSKRWHANYGFNTETRHISCWAD